MNSKKFLLKENKIIILILLFNLMLALNSCKNIEVKDVKCEPLTSHEINQLPIIQQVVKEKSEKQYELQYKNANLNYRLNSDIPTRAKFNVIENLKYNLPRDVFAKDNPYLLRKYFKYYKDKIMKEPKYGIRYSFTFVNGYDEPIESTNFVIKINYNFKNKNVVFTDVFTEKKIIRERESCLIERDIVFNFQQGYESAYFETYTAKNKIIEIVAISENKVGFKNVLKLSEEI